MTTWLTLRQVAHLLGLSEQRIYQLDAELAPRKEPRGAKMVTRWYDAARVEAYRNAPRRPAEEARALAAHVLEVYAHSGFVAGVPEEAERMREGLREIARELCGGGEDG